jgi:hypothetical protein
MNAKQRRKFVRKHKQEAVTYTTIQRLEGVRDDDLLLRTYTNFYHRYYKDRTPHQRRYMVVRDMVARIRSINSIT